MERYLCSLCVRDFKRKNKQQKRQDPKYHTMRSYLQHPSYTSARDEWVKLHAAATLPKGKSPQYLQINSLQVKTCTACPKKNFGVLVDHIYSMLNHTVGTFRKFGAKSVQVLVTEILEKWKHHTVTCWTASKWESFRRGVAAGKGAVYGVVGGIKVCGDCFEEF
jgi:hypothetical protein